MKDQILRTKEKGTRVFVAASKWNDGSDMVYRVKDGHAMWGLTINDLITENEWLKQNEKNTTKKSK